MGDDKSALAILEENKHWAENIEFFFFSDKLENSAHYLYNLEKTPHFVAVGSDGTIETLGAHKDVVGLVSELFKVEEGYIMERSSSHMDLKPESVTKFINYIENPKNFAELLEN